MAIESWNPFQEAISLREAMNSLLQDSFVRPGGTPAQAGHTPLPLDVSETEHDFVVRASLPGAKPDDVQITVHGDTLTIRAESKTDEERKGEHWHLRDAGTECSRGPSRLPHPSIRKRPRPSSNTVCSP